MHTFYNATLQASSDRKKVEFIEVADVANVMEEATGKLAESVQFFMQGCGVLAGAPMPHMSVPKSGSTMEEMDKSDM